LRCVTEPAILIAAVAAVTGVASGAQGVMVVRSTRRPFGAAVLMLTAAMLSVPVLAAAPAQAGPGPTPIETETPGGAGCLPGGPTAGCAQEPAAAEPAATPAATPARTPTGPKPTAPVTVADPRPAAATATTAAKAAATAKAAKTAKAATRAKRAQRSAARESAAGEASAPVSNVVTTHSPTVAVAAAAVSYRAPETGASGAGGPVLLAALTVLALGALTLVGRRWSLARAATRS
jgi:hypothetical protein